MKSQQKQASVVTTIDQFLAQINALSQRTKAAEDNPNKDTEHPSADVDDNTQPAEEGSRSAEHEKDIAEALGPAGNTAKRKVPGGPAAPDKGTGVDQSLTGEDPSVETPSVEDRIEDPGENSGSEGRGETTHPASLENTDINEKYSRARRVLSLIKAAEAPGNELVARLATEAHDIVSQFEEAEKQAALLGRLTQPNYSQQGGSNALPEFDEEAIKNAGAQVVIESLAYTVRDARALAEKTAAYLNTLTVEAQKMAEQARSDEPSPETQALLQELIAAAGTQAPPAEGTGLSPADAATATAAMQPTSDTDEQALIEALLSAADQESGEGRDAEEPAVGDELSPEDLAALEQILAEEGISPEELEAAAMAKASHVLRRQKQASAKSNRRPAKWQPKTAAEAERFRAISKAVRDICRR